MIRLSERMKTMADHIEPGERVADIGTDHGQLPVYLYEKGICPKIVLSDISEASLQKAKGTAGAYQFGTSLSFRVGDGLKVLETAEVDAVIIAGMGGLLIRDILSEDLSLTRSLHKFILQPRKAAGQLRKWLLQEGFAIIGEDIVREGHFLPEIITAVWPGEEQSSDLASSWRAWLRNLPEDDIHFRVPPWIGKAEGPVAEYLDLRLRQETSILNNMQKAKSRSLQAEAAALRNIRYLQGLRKELNDEIQ